MIVLAPFLMIVALVIGCRLGRPVLFVQVRPGMAGRPFRMYKFRTMTDARNSAGDLLPDAERLSPFGKWLRATSIDELPSLLNIVLGDMSLVGPRPLLMQYLKHYSDDEARRHFVRPGLTGWAQVNGRNALTWTEKFTLDTWYVDNHCMSLDIKILLLTVRKVLKRDGINADHDVTMPLFKGSTSEHLDD
jgi:sugar transferase EpsL